MDHKQFISAISQICEEKGISKEKALEVVEAALASAYKKEYCKKGQIIKVNFDEASGDIKVFQIKIVGEEDADANIENDKSGSDYKNNVKSAKLEAAAENQIRKKYSIERNISLEEARKYKDNPQIGDEIRISLTPHSNFGRIAAQTAKQVMIQKIREAEKETIFNEFKDKEGEVVSGMVQRIDGRNVFVDVGKATGILYPEEQIFGERYSIGQRLKVYIVKVDKEAKEASLILSRTNQNIIEKLFGLEVPEIMSGTVEIKSIAREAGSRSKVSVYSNEKGVDSVGSCIGQRGSRIQPIIDELGEKIDIIEWSDDIKKYIKNALSPAKISRIEIDENKKHAIAYADEDQLSLAIGRQGQNVRLAVKLTGWKIDVLNLKEAFKENEL